MTWDQIPLLVTCVYFNEYKEKLWLHSFIRLTLNVYVVKWTSELFGRLLQIHINIVWADCEKLAWGRVTPDFIGVLTYYVMLGWIDSCLFWKYHAMSYLIIKEKPYPFFNSDHYPLGPTTKGSGDEKYIRMSAMIKIFKALRNGIKTELRYQN